MSVRPSLRFTALALVVSLATLPLAAAASPSTPDGSRPPADRQRAAYAHKGRVAAHWQGGELRRGRIHNKAFGVDDWGLTIETAFALAADGTQPTRLARVARAIEHNYYSNYATFAGDTFAGSMAKVLVATEVLGKHPRDFGGHNVRLRVLQLVAPPSAGFEAGRVRDTGSDDFSNTYSQALSVLGLARSGGVGKNVVRYLTKQQCARGFFRIFATVGSTCTRSGSAPDVDATSLALQALVAARDSGAAIPHHAIKRAASWLVRAQKPSGGFFGGSTTPSINANSTGLAAQALMATHHPRARLAAARFVAKLQLTPRRAGSGPARRDIGAIAYDRTALRAALKHGINADSRDQFRRSTPQGLAALIPKPLSTLTVR